MTTMNHESLLLLHKLVEVVIPHDREQSFNYITRCEKAKRATFKQAYDIRSCLSYYWDAGEWITSDQLTLRKMIEPDYLARAYGEAVALASKHLNSF